MASEGRPFVPPGPRSWLKAVAKEAEKLELEVYVVGGCIRDWLLGRSEGGDIDLVCEKDPRPLAERCAVLVEGRVESFGRFGTLRVLGRLRVDFARCRSERYPQPAALPVVSPACLRDDLSRRDFTINAMAAPLAAGGRLGEVIDPHGGLADLKAGRLRVLHEKSFRDDPTRVFRAARFLCRFGLKPAGGLLELARRGLADGHAGLLSRHRLAQELLGILKEEDMFCALRTLKNWGYLDLIHPGLRPLKAGPGSTERLGALALALGGEGDIFLRSLPIDHAAAGQVREALALFSSRRAPRGGISEQAARILRRALPRLPAAALKPLLIDGDDLRSAGLLPGRGYGEILDDAAAAQWQGRFSTRPQALRWLRRRLA